MPLGTGGVADGGIGGAEADGKDGADPVASSDGPELETGGGWWNGAAGINLMLLVFFKELNGLIAGAFAIGCSCVEELDSLPNCTPPERWRSLGIPPANKPDISGVPAIGIDGTEDAGAIDDDDFIPGIDGALPIWVLEEGFPERTPPVPTTLPSIIGALLSFVTVCLSFFPFLMSLSNASFPNIGGG